MSRANATRGGSAQAALLVGMLGEVCALGAAMTWAVSVILFKRSEAISPLGLNLFKNAVALVLLALTLPIFGIPIAWDRPLDEWVRLAVSGMLGISVADTLFFYALRRLGPGLTAVIDCAYTPLMVLLSALLLAEPLGLGFLVGAGLVVLGVACTAVGRDALVLPSRERLLGMVAAFVGIGCLATGVMLARPFLASRALSEVMLVRVVAGVCGQLVWILLSGRVGGAFAAFKPGPLWYRLVPAAVLSTYVAMLLWLGGFKWANASVAAVLNQSSTVFTLILARIFLSEPLSLQRAFGASVAVVGVAVVLLSR